MLIFADKNIEAEVLNSIKIIKSGGMIILKPKSTNKRH
jgi:hypothetical protein